MFEIQHAALREAEREIDRMAARRRQQMPAAARRGRWSLAMWLLRLWPGRIAAEEERPRGVIGDERRA
jgi:hypothetical protein